MRFSRLWCVGTALLAVAACSNDPVSREISPEPSGAIRWVNAIADTVPMDFRFVGYPSNASEPSLPFRGHSGNWRIIPAGQHRVRVFFTNTTAAGATPEIVSQMFLDTLLTLEDTKKYTAVHYGFSKASASPRNRLILIEDVLPTVPDGQVAFRVINAAPALGPVSVNATLGTATGGATSGAPIFATVALGAATQWVNVPVATGTNTYRLTATAPGSTAPLADLLGPAGAASTPAAPGTAPLNAIAGSRQARSAMTVVVFGPQVAYTVRRPDGTSVTIPATTTGGIAVLLDVHPPRISP